MSANQRLGVLLLVGLAFIMGNAWHFAGAQPEKKITVQKWEYKQLSTNDGDEIAKAGDEAWELAAAYSNSSRDGTGSPRLVFKRPKS